jgi:hypothetical protein
MDKLPQAYKDARNKFDAAIDAADAAFVEKTRGYVAILLARAKQMPA